MNISTPKSDPRLDYPATGRNRDSISDVLARVLPSSGTVLEIASGSGQHITHFAQNMPNLSWQPSDPDESVFDSILAWAESEGVSEKVNAPLNIDTRADIWPVGPIDDISAIISINMIHIAPWDACLGLLKNAGRILKSGGVLYLYGPFKVGDQHIAPSNAEFDQSLKSRDERWGVRNLDDVAGEALSEGFQMMETVKMPANNFSVIFQRKP
jgi:SAM-dependent methyltransferase